MQLSRGAPAAGLSGLRHRGYGAPMSTPAERERARAILRRFGRDAVSWQGLESVFSFWFDDEACVPFVDTGSAWIAAGRPWCAPERMPEVVRAFEAAACGHGRRACYFGVEDAERFPHHRALRIGEHALFEPARWAATVARHRRLREQLRRARAKGVTVRRLAVHEVAPGSALRCDLDALMRAWLVSRRLEPMGFVASVEPWTHPADHRYYLAARGGRPIAWSSLVPVPALGGWLLEDTFRAADAPNGTSELLLDLALREATDAPFVSLGLAPLAGPVTPLLRVAATLGRPLYDFGSLHAFKQRLHPHAWRPVWLVYGAVGTTRAEARAPGKAAPPDRGAGRAAGSTATLPHRRGANGLAAVFRDTRAVLDVLRAFAHGSLLRFGVRSLLLHPSGPPWLLAVPLVPWTLLLAVLAVADDVRLLGFTPAQLAGWVLFDALLVWLLFRSAQRPRAGSLVALAAATAADAVVSAWHLGHVGLGTGALATVLRCASVAGPLAGTVLLVWAAWIARRRTRSPAACSS